MANTNETAAPPPSRMSRHGPWTRSLLTLSLLAMCTALSMGAAFAYTFMLIQTGSATGQRGKVATSPGQRTLYRVHPGPRETVPASVVSGVVLGIGAGRIWRPAWTPRRREPTTKSRWSVQRAAVLTLLFGGLAAAAFFACDRLPFVPGDRHYVSVAAAIFLGGMACLPWVPPASREETRRAARPHFEHVRCPECGYDMKGLSVLRCPECGSTYTIEELLSRQRRGRTPT